MFDSGSLTDLIYTLLFFAVMCGFAGAFAWFMVRSDQTLGDDADDDEGDEGNMPAAPW